MLLDTIDETYFAFRSRLRDIRQATTCDCNACRLIPNLNLKFVAHNGRFVRNVVAGNEELTGSDVIIAHRLLKNNVKKRLGYFGYALFTDSCVTALGLDPLILGMREHRESYQEIGEILSYVEDLEAAWSHEQERRRVFVLPAEAQFEFAAEFPASVNVVWDFSTSPRKRLLWQTDFTHRPDQPRRSPRAWHHQSLRSRPRSHHRGDPRLASLPLLHPSNGPSDGWILDPDLRVPAARGGCHRAADSDPAAPGKAAPALASSAMELVQGHA